MTTLSILMRLFGTFMLLGIIGVFAGAAAGPTLNVFDPRQRYADWAANIGAALTLAGLGGLGFTAIWFLP